MSAPQRALSPVVPLAPAHKVGAFACGDQDIDRFLHESAVTEQALRLSQIYVTVNDSNDVMAYFTLSPITVRIVPELLEHIGAGAVPYPSVGGFLLGRLGVHRSLQRQGIGDALVMRAAQLSKREAAVVGGAFLAVDPKTGALTKWYAKFGFAKLGALVRTNAKLGGHSLRMVLPLRSVP